MKKNLWRGFKESTGTGINCILSTETKNNNNFK